MIKFHQIIYQEIVKGFLQINYLVYRKIKQKKIHFK
jgi:hypothetical protein